MAENEVPEEKELALVGKVELRIALADSDAKLQSLLATYLCPLLLKLASPHKSVKDKVISICQHINTRTKSNPIKLPVADLLQQFKKSTNPTVRHFDLLYVDQGLGRLELRERAGLVPIVLQGLSTNFDESPRNAAVIFNLFLRLLHQYPLPPRGSKEDTELRSELKLDVDNRDAPFIADWFGKLMLLNDSAVGRVSPGLDSSAADFLRLYGKESTWQPKAGGLSLIETKVQAAKFLSTAAFTPSEKFMPALLAAGSPNTRLSEIGEEVLRTTLQSVSLDDRVLLEDMYSLLLDDPANNDRSPSHPLLKGRILRLLCKSREATLYAHNIITLTEQELQSPETNVTLVSGHDKGLEATKLRKDVFSFVIWVARMSSKTALEQIAPALVTTLQSYIENQGWPNMQGGSSLSGAQELVSRQRGYESIGLLAQACPQSLLLEANLELLRWLFRSLVGDASNKETSLSIETTLAIIMHTLGGSVTEELEEPLAELLLHYVGLKIGDFDSSGTEVKRSARYVAVRFANRCFPFDNMSARWMDLIALSGGQSERQELLEEGSRGLDPYWFQIMNPIESKHRSLEEAKAYASRQYRIPKPEETMQFLFGAHRRNQLHDALVKSVLFSRNSLFYHALLGRDLEPALTQDWEKSLDALALLKDEGKKAILAYVEKSTNSELEALTLFCHSAHEAFSKGQNVHSTEAGAALREVLTIGPKALAQSIAHKAPELLLKLYGSDHAARGEASQLFALIATKGDLSTIERNKLIEDFLQKARAWSKAVGGVVHQVCGAILCLSHCLCKFHDTSTGSPIADNIGKEVVTLVMSLMMETRDQDLLRTALVSLDQFCIYGLLTEDTVPEPFTNEQLLDNLQDFAKSGNESAVACLGHFAMQCSEQTTAWTIFEKLEALGELRQPELHFSVGSALSCLAVGWSSQALIRHKDVKHALPAAAPRTGLIERVLDKVLDDCAKTKPSLRQASAIWLLCLLQDCSDHPKIRDRLRKIHACFRNLLSDRNSLNQETASRGLALVYELGDREMKDELIRDLVRSFTSNKSNLAGTVSQDTELFEEGTLPTGDGSITTYKDIVDLATEVGDPSLVYKFMSMASSSAIWSSRAAFGRFGLSRVLADASEGGYLAQNPKLYSTLFRYRFDPNTGVRTAMNEIWSTLVPNSQNAIDANFDQILEDLLRHILGKEWRTRQACCAAIADLVQARPIAKYEQHLTEIWNAAFKVCDDIKGSVRKAAMELVRTLTGILTRNLEHGDVSTNNRMLKEVVPFLCGPQGLESAATDIRVFALSAILDIIKKGRSVALRSYIGEMVANHLLPSFTSIEPDVVSYAYMKPENFNLTTEQIDNTRLNSVKLSPIMEAIERCLDMLDSESMKELTSLLSQSMKSLIGVPSKIGASRIMVTLSTKHNVIFKPYAGQFMKLLRHQVLDRNVTVATSAAAACGYLARVSSESAVSEHIEQVKALYFQKGEEKDRFAAADLTCAMVKYATDRAHSFAAELFPFVFLGMHDIDEGTAKEFKTAWEEMAGGSRIVRLYLTEIVALTMRHIESSQWSYKHASSLTVADAITLSGNLAESDARTLWPVLDKALSAKTWQGKEKVLQAFVPFLRQSDVLKQDTVISARAKTIAIREARRKNTGRYRQESIKSLGQYIELVEDVDWYDEISGIVLPMIESLVDDSQAMEVDGDGTDQRSAQSIREETMANCIRTLLRSINPRIRSGKQLNESLKQGAITSHSLSRQHGVLVDNTMLEAQKALMQRLGSADGSHFDPALLLDYVNSLDSKEEGIEMTRLKSAEVIEAIAIIAKQDSSVRDQLVRKIDSWAIVDRSRSVQQTLSRAKRVLNSE